MDRSSAKIDKPQGLAQTLGFWGRQACSDRSGGAPGEGLSLIYRRHIVRRLEGRLNPALTKIR